MSIDLELFESAKLIGKRKEIDPAEEEEAIGGPSQKKVTGVVENIGDAGVVNEGDVDKEEEENIFCDICSSKTHWCRACPWNKRIPLDYVPKVGPDWMVVCRTCEKERLPTDPNKLCSCGYHGKYVVEKMCCACFEIGHISHKDEACMFFGKTGVDDPFYQLVKSMLEDLGVEPETSLEIPK